MLFFGQCPALKNLIWSDSIKPDVDSLQHERQFEQTYTFNCCQLSYSNVAFKYLWLIPNALIQVRRCGSSNDTQDDEDCLWLQVMRFISNHYSENIQGRREYVNCPSTSYAKDPLVTIWLQCIQAVINIAWVKNTFFCCFVKLTTLVDIKKA